MLIQEIIILCEHAVRVGRAGVSSVVLLVARFWFTGDDIVPWPLWPRAQSGVVYDCWRSWYCQRVPLACLWQPGGLAGVILGGMKLVILVYLH